MMEGAVSGPLVSTEIHGFHTLEDLDVPTIMDEARIRWLRPNEIYAMLSNHKYFTIRVKPVQLPKSGAILLFDRKMLRNFRKDGHNWKKKKDGKTVKEAHEHLKVGNVERIHVYYAHGEDNPTFVRRCYWLLDKSLEHIVLVHYRETQELQDIPSTPVNSNSSSSSDQSAPQPLSEELNSRAVHAYYAGEKGQESTDSLTIINHQMRLHEINTLDWDDLVTNDSDNSIAPKGDSFGHIDQENQNALNGSYNLDSTLPAFNASPQILPLGSLIEPIVRSDNIIYGQPTGVQSNADFDQRFYNVPGVGDSLDILVGDGLRSQDSFGSWMNYVVADTPGSSEGVVLESSVSSCLDSVASPSSAQASCVPDQVFVITDVSPEWAFSTETTKIIVTGFFLEHCRHLAKSNLYCVCGDVCIFAEIVQDGVYRCIVSPHSPGVVNLYLSLDRQKPISQVLKFEYRAQSLHDPLVSLDHKPQWEEFHVQMRLVKLLLTTSKSLTILTSKVPPSNVEAAKKFTLKTSHISHGWPYLAKSIEDKRVSFTQAKESLFELTLKNIMKDWLLERVVEGCKTAEYDSQGQGVIHLCAILGYTWAVQMFSWAGLSLDFRDKHGWTALHWAAYCGREKMVAVLLSAGSTPSRVTDPTPENPGGCTPADLAYANGFEGLAAYLSEKALVSHFQLMSIAGNVSGSLQTNATDTLNTENLSEDELHLRDTLSAYRTAADAAGRIQAAFREHSLKIRTKAVQVTNPEEEARNIIAAMKIQHAFRNFGIRKKMAAAARIQYRFRTWKMRKDFLNTRRQVIKIQAAFRGYQVRRQYRKILWSVGVLEKVILRWRLKRKGLRGLQIEPVEAVADEKQESDTEEDFYRTGQKQAVERVERSVIRVQALFRSKKAQEEYQRMKEAHNQATLEYNEFWDPDADMEL